MGDWRVEAVRMKAMCKNDLPCAVISQAHTHIQSHPVINYALKMRSFPPPLLSFHPSLLCAS